MPALVELYTRPGCHLCEIAKSRMLEIKKDMPFGFVEIDVSSDPSLEEKYGESIPVIVINGVFFARFEVDETKFMAQLISLN